jgi:hypothetical protein
MAGDAEQAAFLASQLARQDEGTRLFPIIVKGQRAENRGRHAGATKAERHQKCRETIKAWVLAEIKKESRRPKAERAGREEIYLLAASTFKVSTRTVKRAVGTIRRKK